MSTSQEQPVTFLFEPPRKKRIKRTRQFFSGPNGASKQFSMGEFWSWVFSDVQDNTNRGILAEFIVAKALGVNLKMARVGWANYDIETQDGVRIEVKATGFLQSWAQKELSPLIFSKLKARSWDPHTSYSKEPSYRADVYVFAIQTAKTHKEYNALDLTQWEFLVLPKSALEPVQTSNLTVKKIHDLGAKSNSYHGLKAAVEQAAKENRTNLH